jgi:hypothetical protein
MGKSKEAPSIIPGEDDQNVYLVVDDFGYIGRCWRERQTSIRLIWKRLSRTCWMGSTTTLFGLSVSIPPKAGLEMFQGRSRQRYAAAAICR